MKRFLNLQLFCLTLLSALLLALAQPNEIYPYGQPLFGLLALVPFFTAISRASTYRSAAFLGSFFLVVYTCATLYWLLAFDDFAIWTLGGVVFGYWGYGLVLGNYLRFLSRSKTAYRPFILATGWMVYEYLKSTGFLGLPWGLSLYPFHRYLPLLQTADMTGIWFPAFLVALINALLAEPFLHPHNEANPLVTHHVQPSFSRLGKWKPLLRPLLFWGFLILISLAYGTYQLSREIPEKDRFTILMVQKNNNPWRQGGFRRTLAETIDLTDSGLDKARAQNKEVDLIAWSETSLLYPYKENKSFYSSYPTDRSFTQFLSENPQTKYLFGAPIIVNMDPVEAMNGALFLDSSGAILQTYGKQHPVPFAESIPFWEFEAVRNLFSSVLGLNSVWVLGSENKLFRLNSTTQFAVPICFEDAFPPLCRSMVKDGADLFINLTNDAWSQTISAETQHMVVALFRSIENRRTLIRSTNGGISVVIDSCGRILAEMPPFVKETLLTDVPVTTENDTLTFYTLFGDWFPWAGILLLLFLLIKNRRSLLRTV